MIQYLREESKDLPSVGTVFQLSYESGNGGSRCIEFEFCQHRDGTESRLGPLFDPLTLTASK